MLEFKGKVRRALKSQRVKLQLPTMPSKPQDTETTAVRRMEDKLANRGAPVSQTGATLTRVPKGQTLLHKINPTEENQGQGNGNKQRD
jgi:hypothetical protein